MLAEVKTGMIQAGDGSVNVARAGRFGEVITGEAVGKYYEMSKQGRVFCASQQAGAVMGVSLTATAVTVTLFNPSGSGVNLSLLQTSIAFTALQTTTTTTEVLVYAVNPDPSSAIPTGMTQLTVRPALIGAPYTSMGRAFSAATVPAAPVVVRIFPLAAYCTSGTQLAESGLAATDYVDGAIVLAPNTAVTIQELATTTQATGIISMVWAEIPA